MSVLLGFEGDTAKLLNPYYGREEQVAGVHALAVVGLKVPVRELYDSLRGGVPGVYLIGDAAAPRDIASALEDAVGLCSKLR